MSIGVMLIPFRNFVIFDKLLFKGIFLVLMVVTLIIQSIQMRTIEDIIVCVSMVFAISVIGADIIVNSLGISI